MEIKLAFQNTVTPIVDATTGKLAVQEVCTEPFSIRFESKNEMLNFAVAILKAIQQDHNIVSFNTKGVNIEEFNADLKSEEKHDEAEEPRIPRLIGKE